MRLEISETVHAPNPEMVLHALEICSREFSSEVIRFGDRITLHGLGPSPRAKNVRDTTVFCVNVDDHNTVISGEVKFQASALLGMAPQRDVVLSKLGNLFEQMKAQIELDISRTSTAATKIGSTARSIGTEAIERVAESMEKPADKPATKALIESLGTDRDTKSTPGVSIPGPESAAVSKLIADTEPIAELERAALAEQTSEQEQIAALERVADLWQSALTRTRIVPERVDEDWSWIRRWPEEPLKESHRMTDFLRAVAMLAGGLIFLLLAVAELTLLISVIAAPK